MSKFNKMVRIVSAVLVLASCSGDVAEPKPDPSFHVSTDDTLVVQTSQEGQKVVFTAVVTGARASETTWTVNGADTGRRGARFEEILQAGTYEVCGHNTGMRDCKTIKVEMPAVVVEWYVARPGVGEFLATGTAVTLSAPGVEEKIYVEGSKFSVHPTFLASAEKLTMCLEMQVYPRCIEIAREKFFSPVYVLSVVESWRIERGSYTGNVENISMELGYAQSGMISGNGRMSFFWWNPARLFRKDSAKPVYVVMDSVFTVADSVMVVDVLKGSYDRLGYGEPESISKEAASILGECGVITVHGNSTLQSTGSPLSCVHASRVTGGKISLRTLGNKKECSLEHELGHVIGLMHTNSWASVMNDNSYCSRSLIFTSYDVAMVHAMERTLDLIDKYPYVEHGPIQPWATWYGYRY